MQAALEAEFLLGQAELGPEPANPQAHLTHDFFWFHARHHTYEWYNFLHTMSVILPRVQFSGRKAVMYGFLVISTSHALHGVPRNGRGELPEVPRFGRPSV